MSRRVSSTLGFLAACAALLAATALLVAVIADLDEDGTAAAPATVVRVSQPAGGPASHGPREGEPVSSPKPAARGDLPVKSARRGSGPTFLIAALRPGARVGLRTTPGGSPLAWVGAHSRFGSPSQLSVVATRPGWLGVTSPQLGNGTLGWIRRDPATVELYWTKYWLRVSLSRRTLEVRYGGATVRTFTVTVGGPGTETPPGRYGVTDAIAYGESPYYGCCALALSGHQSHSLPPDWIGGNRLAIHGTPGPVGFAESLGCVRASDESMRFLFAHIPLGTPVFIEA